MAYVISNDCICCGSCEGECPVGAISEGDGKFEINADECVDWRYMRRRMPNRCYFSGIIQSVNIKPISYRDGLFTLTSKYRAFF